MGRSITINNTKAGEIIDLQNKGSVITTAEGVYARPTTKLLKSDFENTAVFDRLASRLAAEGSFIPQISTEPAGSTIGSFDAQQTVSSGTATVVLTSGITGKCDVFVVDSTGTAAIPAVASAGKQYCSLADWDGTKFRLFYSSTNANYASIDSCKTSTDGRTWTAQALTNFPNLKNHDGSVRPRAVIGSPSSLGVQNRFPSYGVYWCGARFIAIGQDNENGTGALVKVIGAISTDGITWSNMPGNVIGSSTNGSTFRVVGFNNDGNNATFEFNDGSTSSTTDGGINWTANSEVGQLPYAAPSGEVVSANDKYFSFNGTYVAYSDDSITWNISESVTNVSVTDVAYGAGLYVTNCGTDGYYLTSPDGMTWTRHMLDIRTQMVSAGHWGGYSSNILFKNHFVYARSDASQSYFLWSADGLAWNKTSNLAIPYGGMWYNKLTNNGSQFCIQANSTANGYSNDGKLWYLAQATPTSFSAMAGDNVTKTLLLPSSGSVYYIKHNGMGHTHSSQSYNGNFPAASYKLVWMEGESKWVAYNTSTDTYYTSATGSQNTWSIIPSFMTTPSASRAMLGLVAALTSIRVGPSGAVANNYVQSLATSSNGTTWTEHTTLSLPLHGTQPAINFDEKSLAYGSGKFLAHVTSAQYATSIDDGATWTLRNYGSIANGMSLRSITWCGSFFLAATTDNASSSCLLKSTDGITWTRPTLSRSIGVYTGVFYRGGRIFCGSYGNWSQYNDLYTSVDGTTWTWLSNFYTPYNKYAGISYDGQRFYAPYSNSLTQWHLANNGYSSWGNVFTPSIQLDQVTPWATNNTTTVAKGYSSNGLLTSPKGDGATWTNTGETQSAVCYSTNKFLTASGLTSTDGTTWTSLGFDPSPPTNITTTGTGSYSFYGARLLVGDGTSAPPPVSMPTSSNYSGFYTHNVIKNSITPAKQVQIVSATTNFLISANGFKTLRYVDTSSMGTVKYIAYFGNIMVLITSTDSIYTSVNDGSTWVEQNITTMMGTPSVVLCDANRLYLFTNTGEVFISTSGTSWTRRTLPKSPTYPTNKSSLAAESSNNVMVNGGDATINWVTSDAGVNWKASTATAGTGTLGITDGTAAYFYGNTNMSITTLTDIAAGYYAVPKISATLPTATRNLTTYEKVE